MSAQNYSFHLTGDNVKLKWKSGAVILTLALMLAETFIAHASAAGAVDRDQRDVPVASWSAPGVPISHPRDGAIRVDRDLYPFHYDDVNQFGDDEAYNSASGKVHTGVRFPIHREDP